MQLISCVGPEIGGWVTIRFTVACKYSKCLVAFSLRLDTKLLEVLTWIETGAWGYNPNPTDPQLNSRSAYDDLNPERPQIVGYSGRA